MSHNRREEGLPSGRHKKKKKMKKKEDKRKERGKVKERMVNGSEEIASCRQSTIKSKKSSSPIKEHLQIALESLSLTVLSRPTPFGLWDNIKKVSCTLKKKTYAIRSFSKAT